MANILANIQSRQNGIKINVEGKFIMPILNVLHLKLHHEITVTC